MRRGINKELAGLAPFSPDIQGAIIPVGFKLPTFTKFTGKTDPEEHIAEFQLQMSFHQPFNRVYCRAFLANLVGRVLKWFNRLPEGCRTYIGRVRHDKDEHSLMTIR
ncbi:hypothetical protein LIER_25902 [Lithospermum erythrorhizon]|uniref:Uncharacterized protein n=1 Tax=Lithospermum erythrorhizon TaxID=34254 RepID=A0AAV3R6R0_LITER